MSSSKISEHRQSAFQRQKGQCCYCGFSMWEYSAEKFAEANQISTTQAMHFQCTAEHLKARKDGGRDTAENIAAACLRCNQLRHRRANPPEPQQYQQLVQKRLDQGKWCSIQTMSKLEHRKPPNIKFPAEHQQARA